MKKTWNIVMAMSRPMLFGILGVAVIAILMGWRLGSLTPGISEPELVTYQSANGLSAIIENAVDAPYKSAVYVSTSVMDSVLGLRLVGATIGALAIVLFYFMAQKIMTVSNAIIVTAMFATTSLLLHTTRTATPNVMLLALLALVAVGSFIRFNKHSEPGWLLASAVIALSLYTPGLVFFILAGGVWQFRRVKSSFEDLRPAIIISCSVIFSLLVAPLVISLVRDPHLWRAFLGIPSELPALNLILQRAGEAVLSLFIISPKDPVFWLGRQPILDVFATALFIYGLITVFKHFRLERLILIFGVYLLTIAWIAISGNHQAMILLLPFVYVVIGLGLQELMDKWLSVFPRNPIAQITGAVFLVSAVLLSINFQTQRYFVAWANSPETIEVYQLELPSE